MLLFEGDRLHGVLPGHADGGDAGERGGAARGHRLTLMIGWWAETPRGAGARASPLGPCGAMPRETRECTWPRLLRARDADGPDDVDAGAGVVPREIAPAWERLDDDAPAAPPRKRARRDPEPPRVALEAPPSINTHFCVRSLAELEPGAEHGDS